MRLPQRPSQHISETASFKIFQAKIPNSWVIRELSERDYGIDLYLELVNDANQLSGELALIQLKSQKEIHWNNQNEFNLSGVEISTSNYWYKLQVPVFLFLADTTSNELYFISTDGFIRKNYNTYLKQKHFGYRLEKKNVFEGKEGLSAFKISFDLQFYRSQFENELLFFLSNLRHYGDYQADHSNRDFHMGIEDEELVFFETMHHNYRFLCSYFNLHNPIPSMTDLKEESRKKDLGKYYLLYEHDLSEWMAEYEKLTSILIRTVQKLFEEEEQYWTNTNPSLSNYVDNLDAESPPTSY